MRARFSIFGVTWPTKQLSYRSRTAIVKVSISRYVSSLSLSLSLTLSHPTLPERTSSSCPGPGSPWMQTSTKPTAWAGVAIYLSTSTLAFLLLNLLYIIHRENNTCLYVYKYIIYVLGFFKKYYLFIRVYAKTQLFLLSI